MLDPGGSIRHALDAAVRFGGFAPFDPAEVLIGMPLRDILRTRTQDSAAIEAMVSEFRRVHQEESWKLAHYHDGFPELVAELRDLGFRTAVVTTKGEAEAVHLMDKLGISHLWDTIIGDDDARPIKPHPAPVLAACERLGRDAADAVMIGDTSFDMDAGQAAGAWTIGVTWGNGSQWGAGPDGGDAIAHDAAGLKAEILQWQGRHKR